MTKVKILWDPTGLTVDTLVVHPLHDHSLHFFESYFVDDRHSLNTILRRGRVVYRTPSFSPLVANVESEHQNNHQEQPRQIPLMSENPPDNRLHEPATSHHIAKRFFSTETIHTRGR